MMLSVSLLVCFLLHARISLSDYPEFSEQWSTSAQLASACPLRLNDHTTRLCGGKSGYYALNSCLQVEDGPFSLTSTRNTMKYWPYVAGQGTPWTTKGFWCQTQNEGALYRGKACMIGMNDGTNQPSCYCCDVANAATDSPMVCSKLVGDTGCPVLFEACVTSTGDGTLLQVGGLRTTTIYDEIRCFDIERGQYREDCEFGPLARAASHSGCAYLKDQELLVVAGGYSNDDYDQDGKYFMKSIQLCRKGQACREATTSLGVALEEARVYPVDDCTVVIAGGRTSSSTFSDLVLFYNACEDRVVETQTLQNPQSEFAFHISDGRLCTVGGLTTNGVYMDSVECANFGFTPAPTTPAPTLATTTTRSPTPRPTTKPPTDAPTGMPTGDPTQRPTRNPTPSPTPRPTIAETRAIIVENWQVAGQYTYGRSSQACVAIEDSTTVTDGYSSWMFGGKKWETSTYPVASNEFYQIKFDSNGAMMELRTYDAREMWQGVHPFVMSKFYCQHSCGAIYQNKLFLVAPFVVHDANRVYIFECAVNDATLRVECTNICDYISCDHIPFEPCVTTDGNLMYISGGQKGVVTYDAISVLNMADRTWVTDHNTGPLLEPISKHSCAVWDGTLFAFGGYSSSKPIKREGVLFHYPMLIYSRHYACFKHSNFFKVNPKETAGCPTFYASQKRARNTQP